MLGGSKGFTGLVAVNGRSQLVVRPSHTGKGCYSSTFGGAPGVLARYLPVQGMRYQVVAFTMAQVRQGALGFQRQLSGSLPEHAGIKVYSVSPFDLDERRRFKDRFGGDIVYFLNDQASQECERLGLHLNFLAEISEDELPRRRTLVVGMPDRTGGAPMA
jgi:hypothetical protein